jgi:hypothetical protein
VVKATPEIIELAWQGRVLEAINSPARRYLPAPGTAVGFFVRPEHVRLIRKDRPGPDAGHYSNRLEGQVIGEEGLGTSWTLHFKLDGPAAGAQGAFDLEIEVPALVYEMLEIARDRRWSVSMHRGAIQVLPSA